MAYPKQGPYPTQPQPQVAGYPPQQQAGAYPPPEQGGAYPPPQGQQPPPPYYPQQGPPPPQAQQQVTTTVIQAQPAFIPVPVSFGEYPVTITDSQGRQVQTRLEYRVGSTTHLIACVICLFGWLIFLPIALFFWVPYLLDGTKDVYHIHPIDGSVVGVYRRR